MTAGVRIVPIVAAEIVATDRAWSFSRTHARDIDAYWAQRTAEQPNLFNGSVHLLDRWSISEQRMRGELLTTDFKSFLYWREHGTPDSAVIDFFPAAAIHSREGWLIVGRMAPAHSSKGRVYTPCGMIDANDIRHGKVDLDGSILREINEEMGLSLTLADFAPPILILDGQRLVFMRPIRLLNSGAEIVRAVESHLRHSSEPELSEILLIKGASDILEGAMAEFTKAYIRHTFVASTIG